MQITVQRMGQESKYEAAATTMRRINRLWLDGDVEALAPMVHPEIAMLFPGFSGRIHGRKEFIDGFRDRRQLKLPAALTHRFCYR